MTEQDLYHEIFLVDQRIIETKKDIKVCKELIQGLKKPSLLGSKNEKGIKYYTNIIKALTQEISLYEFDRVNLINRIVNFNDSYKKGRL